MRQLQLMAGVAMPAAVCGTVRAESEPARLVGEIKTIFTEFKTRNDQRLDAIEAAIEQTQGASAAALLGGGGTGAERVRGSGRLSAEVLDNIRAVARNPNAQMTTQSDPDGGYTVIPQLDESIEPLVRDYSPLRRLAHVVSQERGTGDWEKLLTLRGAQSGWVNEEGDRDTTDSPQFRKVTIVSHEIYAMPEVTNHVLDDSSYDLSEIVQTEVVEEFATQEGDAFVSGSGVGKPRGFLAYDSSADLDDVRPNGTLQFLATGVAGGFPATDPGDVLKDLVAQLKAGYRKGPGVAWMMNSTTANTISKFKDGNGNYLWTQSVIIGQPDRLLGFPVELNEDMPDIAANAMAVAFGNFRKGYAIVDKIGVTLVVDKVTRKGFTKLYFAKRVGGGLLDSRAIKLLKFAA